VSGVPSPEAALRFRASRGSSPAPSRGRRIGAVWDSSSLRDIRRRVREVAPSKTHWDNATRGAQCASPTFCCSRLWPSRRHHAPPPRRTRAGRSPRPGRGATRRAPTLRAILGIAVAAGWSAVTVLSAPTGGAIARLARLPAALARTCLRIARTAEAAVFIVQATNSATWAGVPAPA
jgi:hypothetical protein